MSTHGLQPEFQRLSELIEDRLRNRSSCSDIATGYEELFRSAWHFVLRMLGIAGTMAVMAHSIARRSKQKPLTGMLAVSDNGIDFGALRDHAAKGGCSADEMRDALTAVCIAIFQTLFELAGEALIDPLLRHLEKSPPEQ